VSSSAVGVEKVRRRDLLDAEVLLHLAHDPLASGVVLAIGHDCSINPDPASDDVGVVVAMRDGDVRVEPHSFGPAAADLGPLVAREWAVALRLAE